MASKAEKEYMDRKKELDSNLEAEKAQYSDKLKKLVRNLGKANVIHSCLYFLSQYPGMLSFAQESKQKKGAGDDVRIPVFNSCVAGLIDNETNKCLEFEIPLRDGGNRAEEQLNLDRLTQFRVADQWFTHVFTEQNYHYYESRQLDIESPISVIVAWKLEEKIIFICYSTQLEQAQLEITTQVVSSYVQAVFTSEDNNDEEQYKEAQKLNNQFIIQKSPVYDDLYVPSDTEIEVKPEKAAVVQVKENFEVLDCVRYNCGKLAPNQLQFVEYIADQLKTYPNIIENLAQFKVQKEEFEEYIKNDFFDDYLEFWFVDFMNISTEHDPDDEKKSYITDISLTYQQEHRDKWLESQKVLLKSARAVLEIVEKKSDKTELSLVFELTKYFMENISLYKNNNQPQVKYLKKDANYYRKFRSRQENENKLLFQVEKQPDRWVEPTSKRKEKEQKKDPSKFKCQPRDILAPFVDQNATSESMAKAFKLVLDLAKINSCIVFGETSDKIGEFWNKVCINSDWANLDCYRCCYLNDYRYFMVDDDFLGLTHVGIAGEEEKYPKCQTLKLSYFSMARTLISDTNMDQAVELITNQAVQGINEKKYYTDQFCFTCPAEERNKLLNGFSQIDDAVSREVNINMRCDSWEVIQGDEKGNFLVVRFYFEPL